MSGHWYRTSMNVKSRHGEWVYGAQSRLMQTNGQELEKTEKTSLCGKTYFTFRRILPGQQKSTSVVMNADDAHSASYLKQKLGYVLRGDCFDVATTSSARSPCLVQHE